MNLNYITVHYDPSMHDSCINYSNQLKLSKMSETRPHVPFLKIEMESLFLYCR